MNIVFLTGIIGSIILVTGAAWPMERVSHPVKSVKNWLFLIGGLIMFLFAILQYIAGGSVFFIFLEILVVLASVLMMLNTPDKIDIPIITVAGIALIIWSLAIFEGYNTVIFILGLCGIGLGYAFQTGSLRRDIALTAGSLLIVVFSYLEASWVFFWLNVFFMIFSGYYVMTKSIRQKF